MRSTTEVSSQAYDRAYFENYHSGNVGHPYRKGDPAWEIFFGRVADEIVRSLRPRTVFDAGCAIGFLVEALWDRGVEAHGRDISDFAIDQIRPDVRSYCSVGSITDPIDGSFDLVTCIEVLEHIPAPEAMRAIEHLASVADRVLFSSTPTDFDEPTHVNVHPAIYWIRAFAGVGFRPALGYDPTYLSPYALLFERSNQPVSEDEMLGAVALINYRIQLAAAQTDQSSRSSLQTERLAKQLDLERRYTVMLRELEAQRVAAAAAQGELDALQRTKVMRYSNVLRRVYARLRTSGFTQESKLPTETGQEERSYERWIQQFDTLSGSHRTELRQRVAALADPPLVSVLLPVYDPPEPFLRRALDSVLNQIYSNWELCIVDDCSQGESVAKILDEYAARDTRVRIVRHNENRNISGALNTALAMANGEWALLLDHDDELAQHALVHAVLAVADRPRVALLYSDEDKIDAEGRRSAPFFKPDFDPLLLLAQNYLCHMTMLRRGVVEQAGGFREGMEGSQDWDLILRVTAGLDADQIVHVPRILYHWRMHAGSTAAAVAAKPYAIEAGKRAVRDHLENTDANADVMINPVTGLIRVKWHLPEVVPKVSIMIPTRDGKHLGRCLDSLFRVTSYPHFEVILVDNGSVEPSTRSLLDDYRPWMTIIRDERPFNFSALNNRAARECTGEILCLLNDDCEIVDEDWLSEMVSQLMQPGVGAVGAKLLYANGQIQHAGVIVGLGGVAAHVHRHADRLAYGYFGWLYTARSLSAVTGACLAVKRHLFEELGGLDEVNLEIAFNDIDFCLRIRELGWRIVWTPFATLVHPESVSRGSDSNRPVEFGNEINYMQRRWAAVLTCDPAYNLNLSLESENFDLAFPPRV